MNSKKLQPPPMSPQLKGGFRSAGTDGQAGGVSEVSGAMFGGQQSVAWRFSQVVLEQMEFDDMLRVTVMGNLGSDAEVRFSARENRIASFRIAVNQVRTNTAGVREDTTEWFRVSVMGRQAEYASHLLKGQRVLVDGRGWVWEGLRPFQEWHVERVALAEAG